MHEAISNLLYGISLFATYLQEHRNRIARYAFRVIDPFKEMKGRHCS